MNLKLNKYKCGGCYLTIYNNGTLRQCEECSSTLLEEQELSAEDYIHFLELELESANHHDYVELPEKLLLD